MPSILIGFIMWTLSILGPRFESIYIYIRVSYLLTLHNNPKRAYKTNQIKL
jgi:hypothetical protein